MKKFLIIFFVIALILSGCGRTKDNLKPQIKTITLNSLSNVPESAKEAYSELVNGKIILPTDKVIIETTPGDEEVNEVLSELYPDLKFQSQDYTDIVNGKSKVWIFVIYSTKDRERIIVKSGRNVKIIPIRNNTFKRTAGITYDKCKDSTVIIKKIREYFKKYYNKNVIITGIELVSSGYVDTNFPSPLYGFRYSITKPRGTIFLSADNGMFIMGKSTWSKKVQTKP